MKALLTGATGAVGRKVASELAQSREVESLVLAGRDPSAVERLARLLGGGRVTSMALDVTDTARFISAARDADVVVNTAGPYYLFEPDCVRAAIEAGTHYVSLCDDEVVADRVLAFDRAARDAGVTVLSGFGMSPGLTNLLVALAAEDVETPEEIEIAVAASSADTPGQATTLHFLAQMAAPAHAISDHATQRTRAGTSPRLIYFPDPVGWVETFRSGHPEVMTLPKRFPGLRSLRFRIGLTERAAMDMVRASAAARLLATEQQRRLWLRMSEPMRPALEALPPRGAAWTAARVDVRGRSSGRVTTVSLAVVDHLANLAAVPLAEVVRRIPGDLPRGVVPPDEAVDARELLGAIAARGIRVAKLDPAQV